MHFHLISKNDCVVLMHQLEMYLGYESSLETNRSKHGMCIKVRLVIANMIESKLVQSINEQSLERD